MDRWTDKWKDRPFDIEMSGQEDRQMERQTFGRRNERIDGQTDGQMYGYIGRQMLRQIDGQRNEWIDGQTHIKTDRQIEKLMERWTNRGNDKQMER